MLTGCGDNSKGGDKSKNGDGQGFRSNSMYTPIALTNYQECSTRISTNTYDGVEYHQLSDGVVVTGKMNQSVYSDENGIRSGIINGTIKNSKSNMSFKINTFNGLLSAQIGMEMTLIPEPLDLCRQDPDVETKEAVALTAIGLLNKAYEFYQNLGFSEELPEAQLNVHQEMKLDMELNIDRATLDKVAEKEGLENDGSVGEVHETISVAMTDNAAWTEQGGGYQFIILPQSVEARDNDWFNGYPLWRIPFVMSHEFGHHISAVFFPELVSTASMHDKAAKRLLDSMFVPQKINTLKSLSVKGGYIDVSEVATAIGEGFADIYAYAETSGKTEMDQLKCMKYTRDLNSDSFYNGKQKILTEDVWNKFSGLEDENDGEFSSDLPDLEIPDINDIDCNAVDFTDPHAIGAILAFGVRKILESENTSDWIDLGRSSILWLKSQKTNYDMSYYSYDGEWLMKNAVLSSVEVARSVHPERDANERCRVLENQFPYFYKKWEEDNEARISECFE